MKFLFRLIFIISFVAFVARNDQSAMTVVRNEVIKQQRQQSSPAQLATKIITRWHQTLDVKDIFADNSVQSLALRKISFSDFQAYYQFVFGLADDDKFALDIDEELLRQGLYAFLNNISLQAEVILANSKSLDNPYEEPKEIKDSITEMSALGCKGTITKSCLISYISAANKINTLRRKLLSPGIFHTPQYLKNLKMVEKIQKEKFRNEPLKVENLPNEVKAVRYLQGVFNFVFVEENNQLKLHTILFDP